MAAATATRGARGAKTSPTAPMNNLIFADKYAFRESYRKNKPTMLELHMQ